MQSQIVEFIGVYDADSTLIGEMSYWIKARVGKAHCALCDITHGMFTKKQSWRVCEKELPVPFHTFHRNDAPLDVLQAARNQFPLVLARTTDGLTVVLGASDLEDFKGDPVMFMNHLQKLVHAN